VETVTFKELPLSEEVQLAIAEMGFEKPSPIQAQAIPHLLEGHDLIGQAQTGTGKTAAFAIPALENCEINHYHPQTLVLCPTRELANQVAQEFGKLSKYKKGLHVAAVYGGESIGLQLKALRRGVHIVIGTPGRVIDHIERGSLDVSKIKQIILDEADEMLNMGFIDDIEKVLSAMPAERQTVFFSATMPQPILDLTKRFQQNPKFVKITQKELTSRNIEQSYFAVKTEYKTELLARLVEMHDLNSAVVFCNTKAQVDELVEKLIERGIGAEALHGDLRQAQRNVVMQKFRTGQLALLVATDVAARGIDVEQVEAVVNFDVPLDPEYYVHRIGRTGRAGKTGKSFTFVSPRDLRKLREIENYAHIKINQAEIPSYRDVAETRYNRFADKVKETIEADFEGEITQQYGSLVKSLLAKGYETEEILAAVLKLHLGEVKNQYQDKDTASMSFQLYGDKGGRSSGGRFERSGGRFEKSNRYESKERSSSYGNGGGSYGGDKSRKGDSQRMVRLFVNLGKSEKIRKTDLLGAITGETGIPSYQIGLIDVLDKYSFVDVAESVARNVVNVMNQSKIKGKKVRFEVKS
jgi:ATP-dependent RNA helicase DeaD